MNALELNWFFYRVPAPRIRLHQMKLHEGFRLVDAEEDPAKAGDDLVKGSQLRGHSRAGDFDDLLSWHLERHGPFAG